MSDSTRRHELSVVLPARPELVFAALITPSAICAWWGASTAIVLPEKDGFWNAAWGDPDDPDYITFHRITEYEFPRVLELDETRYVTKFEPPPFDLNVTSRFEVEPLGDGRSKITVIQDGFPSDPVADEFYAACEKGWRDTFEGLRKYIESAT